MNKLFVIMIMGLSLPLVAMEPEGMQLGLCPQRNAAYNKKKLSSNMCPFCDNEILKTNFIVKEDLPNDTRIILNKNPYCDTRQARHFVIMTIAHVITLSDFTYTQLKKQVGAAHQLSIKLADTCYTHEYFKNYGKYAGQTVDHLHDQQIFFLQPPASLPEQIKMQEQTPLLSMDDILKLVKAELQLPKQIEPVSDKTACAPCCYNCWVKNSKDDESNFVVDRFENNLVCLPHFQKLPGEVAIVPYQHAAGIQYLPCAVLDENRELAEQLLMWLKPYMKEIRDCDGGNIYTKSMGSKASAEDLKKYHVYTRVMPRTAIPLTPGFFDGNSCKLDYDPKHLRVYLKEKCRTYREMVRQRDAG